MRTMLRRQTASALGVCAAGVALPATVLLLVQGSLAEGRNYVSFPPVPSLVEVGIVLALGLAMMGVAIWQFSRTE